MKKRILAASVALLLSVGSFAGGLMTNTNYHVAFDRMMARGATFDIDAAYSNPAGMAWTKEGWQLSLNFQKPWQNRDIELDGTKYEGKASAPIVPALFVAYKHDRWAISSMIESWVAAARWNMITACQCSTYCWAAPSLPSPRDSLMPHKALYR